jgi:queuine tRNA-ribosyltransferase
MEIQSALGSEIVMVFDECAPGDAGVEATRNSLEMTARWAKRSKDRFDELQDSRMDTGFLSDLEFKDSDSGLALNEDKFRITNPESRIALSGRQALFGIVQGAGHLNLRKESLERTTDIGFDGYAIGGLSVGEEKSVMYEVIDFLAPQMPKDAPRYLMGVGTPEDLIEAVWRGVDMFDCVMPTRNGRSGGAFTSRGKINIRNAQYATNEEPLDAECPCSVCRRYSKAYLRHLYQAKEMLAATLISHHNLAFFLDLMQQIRQAIKLGNFAEFRREFLSRISNN